MTTPRRLLVATLALPLVLAVLAACSTTPAGELAPGDCLNAENLRSGDIVGRVRVLECSENHDTEVISAFDVDGDAYPGADQLNEIASRRCTADFREYVGVDYLLSDLELVPLIPSEQGWGAGDHRIICTATAPEPITGSVGGTGR